MKVVSFYNIAFLLFAWVLLVFWINPLGDFPLNDDWQYGYPVKQLVEKGQIEYKGKFAPNILLQVLWAGIFCKVAGFFSFTVLRISTLVAAFIAIILCYRITFKLSGSQLSALLLAGSLSLNPLFFSLSFTFMSDVPFLSCCMLCLLAFYNYLESRKNLDLYAATLFSIAAFLVRQPGILFLPGMAAIFWWIHSRTTSATLSAIGIFILAVLCYLAFDKFGKPLLGINDNLITVDAIYLQTLLNAPSSFFSDIFKRLLKVLIYLGAFAIPIFPFLIPRMQKTQLFSRPKVLSILIFNIFLFFLLWKVGKTFPFGGNILFNFGLGPELLVDVYTLGINNTPKTAAWIWFILHFISQLSISYILLFIIKFWKNLPTHQQYFFIFLALVNGIYVPLMSITASFDRFFLLPTISLLLLLSTQITIPSKKTVAFFCLPFVFVSVFSVLATKDYLNWNTAKHQAFQYLRSQQIPLSEMDAGFEYNGFYNYHKTYQVSDEKSFWWVENDTYLITFGPVPNYEEIQSFEYYRWLSLGNDKIRVLKKKISD